ncbi:MAG TPA: hypothetical protein VF115_10475 [Acidimicrobiia bacterium]
MPAYALLSLRGRKYGDDWEPVWRFLQDRHDFPGPLGLDEAVDEIVAKLKEKQSLVPGQVAPTVYELLGEAGQIGLRPDHIASLSAIVEPEEERRLKLLHHASEILGWDQEAIGEWGDIPRSGASDDSEGSRAAVPPVTLLDEQAHVSLHQWTKALSDAGLLTTAPAPDAPACTSANVDGGSDGRATTVFGRFEIEAELNDLRYATDPMNWPDCSWFFISMTQQGPVTSLQPPDDVGNTAYTCPLEEKVGMEDVLTVSTPLTTRYFVGTDSVGMEFDLTPGTGGDGKIDVDHGYLLAEKHPTDSTKLIVTSQKTFSFVGLDDLPFSFLCEFGWVDMMRAMAQCRAPGGGTP